MLLHGIGDSSRMWTPVLGLLAGERECWALDLPGFGRSLTLRDEDPTPPALARAVVAFMAEQGVARFHVAGNSLGGGVALEIARAGAARSVCAIGPIGFAEGRELLLLDTSLRATRKLGETILPALDRVPLAAPVRRLLTLQMIFRGQRVPAELLADTLRDLALAPGFLPALGPMLAYRFEGALPCPVTVAWGEHDRLNLYGPQSARARERLADAHHVTLTGCGHIATWDDPEQVARVLLAASAPGAGVTRTTTEAA